MKRAFLAAAMAFIILVGCGGEKNPVSSGEPEQTGKISLNVTWPQGVVTQKAAARRAPDKITVYIYQAGKKITEADLKHEGTRGTSEITLAAQSGYRLELIAIDDSFDQVLYTGYKDGLTVAANTTSPVDIAMSDAAPVLSPAQKTGDSSYTITWTSVPLAVSYLVEECASEKFISGNLTDDTKLSSTVYSGSETTKAFTGKSPGTYYYLVCPVFSYFETYSGSAANTKNWDFYVACNYGPLSNTISVQAGPNGALKIDIPWPSK